MPSNPLRVLTHIPSAALARMHQELPDVEWVEVPQEGPPPDGVRGEILFTTALGSPNLGELVEAAGVRWIHTFGTGVDRFPPRSGGRSPADLCARRQRDPDLGVGPGCDPGVRESPARDLDRGAAPELERRRNRRRSRTDAGPDRARGEIGVAIAERALPFGMRVVALRRTSQPSPIEGVELVPSLEDLLPRTDHLVVAAAATPQTRHLIGAGALRLVKTGVHLINIARGSLIDQDALREALDDGRVARASLDVCEPEPLPEGHWLYRHPGVRLSPHCSWIAPGALERLFDSFADNLGRWKRGEPLAGRVDLQQRY